jgi:PAS domain S-box-containing protein
MDGSDGPTRSIGNEPALAQAYLAAIVESSDDAIIAKDLNGIVQSCNHAAERLFGYSAEELVGQSIRILIPPDRQAEEDLILSKIRSGERIAHFETVRLHKDGSPIDISLTVSPVRDATGRIVGVSKTARDITEQKRIAAELAAQQEWFRITLASIGDGIIAADPHGCVTYMNQVAESLTGWTTGDAVGHRLEDVFQIVNEHTRAKVENPVASVIRTGRVVGLANHTLLISRDGVERPISDSAAPILDAAGTILGVVLVFRDFTQQRAAEEAVAEQREWFRTTLASIGDGVIATDRRGRVAFMNGVAESLTGWAIEQARERPCTDVFKIVNESTRRAVDNPVTRVLAEGVVVGLANHTMLIAADGTERPIDDSGAPIRHRDGQTIGAVLVFRDVSERRRAEAEHEMAALERERLLAAERTARAEAERANRLKDDFVAMVSHELRTPLNAILGWTDLLLRNRHDEAFTARGLDIIARNTRLQTQLISDLLDISRIVSGKLRLDIQSLDLASIIDAAIETVQHTADEKSITIVRDLDRSLGPTAGDPSRLQQVVWNLLANAVKFTPKHGRVDVILRRTGTGAETVVLDNGVGIRQDFLPYVFDRFQQADPSLGRRFGGLGLGLSIVKSLVEFHGGTVSVASEGEDRGAMFTVMLPFVAPPELRREARAATGSSAALAAGVSLHRLRVLVVEDDPDAAGFVKNLLEMHGAAVVTVTSAAEALAAVAESRPDILISDIGLPERDGYQLIEEIRRRDGADAGPLLAVALTAFARSEDRTRALLAGYQAHVAKPVESSELLATVASLAEVARAQRPESKQDS